jgi:hypothetical protein
MQKQGNAHFTCAHELFKMVEYFILSTFGRTTLKFNPKSSGQRFDVKLRKNV